VTAPLETRRVVIKWPIHSDEVLPRSLRAISDASVMSGGLVAVEVELIAGLTWKRFLPWGLGRVVARPSEYGSAGCLPVAALTDEDRAWLVRDLIAASVTSESRYDREHARDLVVCEACGGEDGVHLPIRPPGAAPRVRGVHDVPVMRQCPKPPRAPVPVAVVAVVVHRRARGRAHQRRQKAGLVFPRPTVEPEVADYVRGLLTELRASGITWSVIGTSLGIHRTLGCRVLAGASVTPFLVGAVARVHFGGDVHALEAEARAWSTTARPSAD
jgi:hypothetical protein